MTRLIAALVVATFVLTALVGCPPGDDANANGNGNVGGDGDSGGNGGGASAVEPGNVSPVPEGSPVRFAFTSAAPKDDQVEITYRLSNTSKFRVTRIQFSWHYLDAAGKPIESSPFTWNGSLDAGSSTDEDWPFAPAGTVDLVAAIEEVVYEGGAKWLFGKVPEAKDADFPAERGDEVRAVFKGWGEDVIGQRVAIVHVYNLSDRALLGFAIHLSGKLENGEAYNFTTNESTFSDETLLPGRSRMIIHERGLDWEPFAETAETCDLEVISAEWE